MVTSFCPTLSADPAIIFTDGAYTTFMNLAPKTFNQAVAAAGELTSLTIEPMQFNVDFNFDGQLTPFQRPPRPSIDLSGFQFAKPADPSSAPVYNGTLPALAPAPTFSAPDPNINFGASPDAPTIDAPEPPPNALDLVIPQAPDYVLPQLPTFEQLNLPKAPAITLPQFEGERPIFVEPVLNENWSFTAEKYTSELLGKVRAKVELMMRGDMGLGPIEDVLFQRGRARIDVEVARAIDTRTNEFAARGFSEPNGILNAALAEILQGGLDAKADINSQITIRSYEETLQNVRFAVQQGIALEQLATNLHIQEQQMALQAAQFLRETSLAILNARVTVFNARLQAYQTDAQVLGARIQAELARVEVYRAQIEGERVRGEINEQRVRIYAEQIRSLSVMADFYRSRVEGVKAQADVERSKVERFKAMIDGYSARWRAYGEEVGAWKAQIDGENAKATVHRSLVDAFATRTQAWGTQEGNKIAISRLGIDQHGQKLQVWRGELDKMLAMVQAETARIGAFAQGADAQARIYTADAGVETAASAASDRTFQLGLERANAQASQQLKAAEIRIQENIQLSGQIIELQKTQAQVLSQLAASSLSAMNFSASVSSSRSQSKSCSESLSYSGEAPDL